MIKRFNSAKGAWSSTTYVEVDTDSPKEVYTVLFSGEKKLWEGMDLDKCISLVKKGLWKEVKDGSWKEVEVAQPLGGEVPITITPKKKRVYGEVKASDNHYHRILVRKGTKAIVKNSNTYYQSKYFVVDILTGKVEHFAETLKGAKCSFAYSKEIKDES